MQTPQSANLIFRVWDLIKRQAPVYLLCGCTFVVSTYLTIYLNLNLLALGAVGSLVAALFELVRDNARHQRELELQKKSQRFDLAIVSHMAERVFEKHVAYVEEYMAELDEILAFLTQKGPDTGIDKHIYNLRAINRRYTAWTPKSLRASLIPFENKLFEIGQSSFVAAVDPEQRAQERAKALESILILIGARGDEELVKIESVKEEIRKLLGIEVLANARVALFEDMATNR